MSAAQRQREIAKLLMQLDQMLKQSGELAIHARERVSVGGLARYRRFTRKVRDFFALAALTQERLDAAPEEMEELIGPMTTALDRLHARMVVQFVEGSSAFFASFARVKALPIGTHEMCGVELRGLNAIRGFLDDPLYDGDRGAALRTEADRIAALMRTVMDRIPPLPDFGDAPSIGPKGTLNTPLKGPNAGVSLRPSTRTPTAQPAAQRRPEPAAPPAQRQPAPPPRPAVDPEPPPRPVPEVRELTFDSFGDEDGET